MVTIRELHRQAALKHLQIIAPRENWSLQEFSHNGTVKLCRRGGIPLTDNAFVDLFYDGVDVVGVLSSPSSFSSYSQAQILVDSKGQPVRGMKLKTVRIPTDTSSSSSSTAKGFNFTSPNTDRTRKNATSGSSEGTVRTLDEHQWLWQGVGGAVLLSIAAQFVFKAVYLLSLVAVPLLYMYMVSHCPSDESFDAKQQLKRVLRGAHLPDTDPNKPKGLFSEALARLQATVTTELATLPGYDVTLITLAGAMKIACVRVPTANRDYYWIGACQNWYYVYNCDIVVDQDGRQ